MTQAEHECPAKDCAIRVPLDLLACKEHWFALPKPLRKRISDAWRLGELDAWATYRQEALQVLAA